MVEGQALIEWSPEIGLSLSQRFCSWVVPEMDSEYMDESLLVVDSKLLQDFNEDEEYKEIEHFSDDQDNILAGCCAQSS